MTLLDQIKDAGIIGAGGAGFPTHVKLNAQAEYLLMNGAECEPLLRVDQQLMGRYPDEIIGGFAAAAAAVGARRAIIGIKIKHQEVIATLRARIEALGLSETVSVHELADVYPAGDEQVLVYELTGRVVPEAGIPLDVGCVVINSETALNIWHAMRGEAVTDTWITIAGDVPQRLTLKVPVGTPLMEVLRLSGIDDFSDKAVIDGGPMMGPVLDSLDGHLTKKQKGFIILPKHHPLIRKKTATIGQVRRVNRGACEQCRMCTDLCPRYLLGHNMQPHKIMNAMTYAGERVEGQEMASLCCQCGLCELFACQCGLFPKSANVYYKTRMAEEKVRYQRNKDHFEARTQRKWRLLPSKRLVSRLALAPFDVAAPLTEETMRPETVSIPLVQHIGAPAQPLVAPGEAVQRGQRIGQIPEGALGASVHASVAGVVEAVGATSIVIRRTTHG